jgi:hypothetical protein
MRAAYYESTSLTGSGQNIGLLEYLGFDIADVNTYYKNVGQTRSFAVTGVSTDGSSVNCVYPSCDDTEQTLDITQAGGMAPGVTTVYVYVSDRSCCSSARRAPSPLDSYLLTLTYSGSWMSPISPHHLLIIYPCRALCPSNRNGSEWLAALHARWPGSWGDSTTKRAHPLRPNLQGLRFDCGHQRSNKFTYGS